MAQLTICIDVEQRVPPSADDQITTQYPSLDRGCRVKACLEVPIGAQGDQGGSAGDAQGLRSNVQTVFKHFVLTPLWERCSNVLTPVSARCSNTCALTPLLAFEHLFLLVGAFYKCAQESIFPIMSPNNLIRRVLWS